ncbi:MAG: hypothetical protein SFV51_13120 [Bryobacteraceae bacterium]|nr:hypothetical protein [Bryobacteraceae bacterium]
MATRSAQSFGPILAERAETIGKDKFFFGFASQFFRFNSIDGVDLSRISAVFQHQPTPNPVFGDDFITTENFLDLNIGQFTGYFTYGLTDRIDLSVAIPMVSASFNVISRATIQRVGTGDDRSVHFFQSGDGTTAQFSGAASASGLGDIMTRIKGTVMRTPRAALAAGLDLRVPTGDEYNFLGSGAAGLKPFVVMSFKAGRVSPHLNGAFQWNGKSVLAGNVAMGDKRKLPNEISFIAGADIGLSPKLTLAADILGLRRENAQRLTSTPFQAANGAFYNNIAFRRGGLSQYNGAVGFKINGTGNLLLAFNLLFKLNNDGLRGRVIPLISLSYSL